MPNPDHINILKRGPEVWNSWRDKNPREKPNLSKANLNFANLEGINLSDSCLQDAELLRACLDRTDLRNADLRNADLTESNINQSLLTGSYLVGAHLAGARLQETDLSLANLSQIDATNADFYKAVLNGIYMVDANLQGANLSQADLVRGNLSNTYLRGVNLIGADLREADLNRVDLREAKLDRADLSLTDLRYSYLNSLDLRDVPLFRANLVGASLTGSILIGTNFSEASLQGANLNAVQMGGTIFADNDLSSVEGLESIVHRGPSSIGVDTLFKSGGKIPEVFLRGCGFSDWEIEDSKLRLPHLNAKEINDILYRIYDLRAHQAIQINPLFISYSHADSSFVNEMEHHLDAHGIRFWRDIHHATAGRLEKQVDQAIRLNPTVLLVLSANSVKSDWVQHEARLARKLEIENARDVLCPIAPDDSWRSCKWPERLREQIMEYNILDFSDWRDENSLRRKFTRLVNGLDMFYK